MQTIKIDLPQELKKLELHIFADEHIGDSNFDFERLMERVNYVANTKNAYCLLNGDIINNATTSSVSDSYSESIPPMEQLQKAIDIFSPIKDKIIAITSGNHENRTYKTEGIDISRLLALQLGISERYSPTSALIFLRFGKSETGKKESNGSGKVRKICYTIYALHGSGGGRKEGSKANRLCEMASIVDADIYIHSHTHLPMVIKESFFRTDVPNSTVRPVNKLFVNNSANLNYGGYGERAEFKPTSKDTPTIYLDGTKKKFTAEL